MKKLVKSNKKNSVVLYLEGAPGYFAGLIDIIQGDMSCITQS